MSDWLPADAAPKDGTEIILANVHKRHQWIDEWVTDKDDDRGGYWMMCDQWDVPETPTHFKFLSPLPDAPPVDWPDGKQKSSHEDCPRCKGSGFEADSHTPCEWCGGDGWMPTKVEPTPASAEEVASAVVNEVFAGYVTHLSVRTAKQLAMNAIGLTLERLAGEGDRYGDEQEYHSNAATLTQLEGERN